jgi:hypothetical protein
MCFFLRGKAVLEKKRRERTRIRALTSLFFSLEPPRPCEGFFLACPLNINPGDLSTPIPGKFIRGSAVLHHSFLLSRP